MITSFPDSSQYYRGGFILNSTLTDAPLDVSSQAIKECGEVSDTIAEAMAQNVREKFSTDFGLSITGICRVTKQPKQKADILYIGIADANGTRSWQQQFVANRTNSRERAAVAALFRMRERLLELKIIKQ